MKDAESYQKWRYWPIIFLSFFYPVNASLINLAIPLYYFKIGLSIEIIGFLAAGTAMTYCFSPLLLNKVSEKINRRRSIILGTVGISFTQFIYYFTLEPIPFLIARISEGFMAGFIWSNLQSSISDNIERSHNKYIAKYNFSWNSGVLSGFLLGALILYLVGDLEMVFYIAPVLIATNAIIIIFFFQESTKIKNEHQKQYHTNLENNLNDNNQEVNIEIIKGNIVNFTKYSISVILPVLYIITYCLARISVNFLYPIKSEILGFDTYTVYLLSFFGLTTQLVSMTIVSYLSMDYLKRIPIISILALIFILIFFAINSNFIGFFVLFLLIGSITGVLYGASLKLFLSFNVKNNTSKYSSICESLIGITFLLGPIATAFIASFDLNFAFYALSVIFSIALIINLIYVRKITENN